MLRRDKLLNGGGGGGGGGAISDYELHNFFVLTTWELRRFYTRTPLYELDL